MNFDNRMDLDINFVSRTDINTAKRRSKYRPLIEALQEIKEGGRAVKVSFGNRSGFHEFFTTTLCPDK